jgi:hypothetical protein
MKLTLKTTIVVAIGLCAVIGGFALLNPAKAGMDPARVAYSKFVEPNSVASKRVAPRSAKQTNKHYQYLNNTSCNLGPATFYFEHRSPVVINVTGSGLFQSTEVNNEDWVGVSVGGHMFYADSLPAGQNCCGTMHTIYITVDPVTQCTRPTSNTVVSCVWTAYY